MAEDIIFYHYAESIFSHRVEWYLKLAGVQYSECIQPPYLPRPDIAALGVSYRRMPLLSIGRHIYCDSRLILSVLQTKFPLKHAHLTPEQKGLEKLFQSWNIDGGVFWRVVALLPVERMPLYLDPKFAADRADLLGGAMDAAALFEGRPEAMAHVRIVMQLMEETFLADGREWVLGSKAPTASDIEAGFLLLWLLCDPAMEGALTQDCVNEQMFPKTYVWVYRLRKAVADAANDASKLSRIDGDEAQRRIKACEEDVFEAQVDASDPLGLQQGQMVEVWPTDTGMNHHDQGELVSLSVSEVCIRNSRNILVHFPRWNFRIQALPDRGRVSTIFEKNSLRLLYHPMSPFARKVYMLACELGIEDQIELETVVVAPVFYPGWSDNNDDVARYNPLAKIPTLVIKESGDGIYDSRTICEFLQARAQAKSEGGNTAQDWRLRALHACADGMLDANSLIIYENKIRAERDIKFDAWIDGQKEKIMRGFDRLELEANRGTLRFEVPDGTSAGPSEVAIAVALAYMDINKYEWRNSRPKLDEWFNCWQKRDSFVQTRPDVDWKTGEPADIGFAREALAGKKV